jgi:hypothetical protein
MTSKKTLAVGCLLMALVGGIVSNWLLSPMAANAQEGERTKHVVTASCFRVTDEEGRTRAELGLSTEGAARLQLFDKEGRARVVAFAPATGDPRFRLLDENGSILNDGSQSTSVTPQSAPYTPQWHTCPQCGGTGNSSLVCPSCNGTGLDATGNFACGICNGRRFQLCSRCNGTGKVQW